MPRLSSCAFLPSPPHPIPFSPWQVVAAGVLVSPYQVPDQCLDDDENAPAIVPPLRLRKGSHSSTLERRKEGALGWCEN